MRAQGFSRRTERCVAKPGPSKHLHGTGRWVPQPHVPSVRVGTVSVATAKLQKEEDLLHVEQQDEFRCAWEADTTRLAAGKGPGRPGALT